MDRSFSHHSWLSECIVHQRLGEDGGVLPSLHGVTSPTVAVGGKNMSEIRIIVQVSFKGSVQSNIIYETSHQFRVHAPYWMLGAGALG